MNNYSVLIIDDDEVDRKTVRRSLAEAGWIGRVAEAPSAADTYQKLGKETFDCILLDYHLPGTSGLEVLSTLVNDLKVQSPVVMLTGEGNEMIAVEAMKRGAADYLPKSLLTSATLSRVIHQVVGHATLQRELDAARATLAHQALYDSLTNLGNRNLFLRDLQRAIANTNRNHNSFCLLMMDLDKFKEANDRYGHVIGDAILAAVGARLTSTGRACDAFYRLGGDEFTAIIEGADERIAHPIVQRFRSAISAQPLDYKDVKIAIGVSIGVVIYRGGDATADALIHKADLAMYEAKRSGQGIAFAPSDT